MMKEQLEDSSHQDGQADHDRITVLLPSPGCQVDSVIVTMFVAFIRRRRPVVDSNVTFRPREIAQSVASPLAG